MRPALWPQFPALLRAPKPGLWLALLSALPLSSALAAVDVNQATEAQLDGLRGLGPATTRQILAERSKAPFKDWQDLLSRVKGLGPATAPRLSAEGLTVEGQAYPGPDTRQVRPSRAAHQAPGH